MNPVSLSIFIKILDHKMSSPASTPSCVRNFCMRWFYRDEKGGLSYRHIEAQIGELIYDLYLQLKIDDP